MTNRQTAQNDKCHKLINGTIYVSTRLSSKIWACLALTVIPPENDSMVVKRSYTISWKFQILIHLFRCYLNTLFMAKYETCFGWPLSKRCWSKNSNKLLVYWSRAAQKIEGGKSLWMWNLHFSQNCLYFLTLAR